MTYDVGRDAPKGQASDASGALASSGSHAVLCTDSPASTVTAPRSDVGGDSSNSVLATVPLRNGRDTGGAGRTVTRVSSRGSTGTITTVSATTDYDGQATFYVKSSATGACVLTASDATDSALVNQTLTITFRDAASGDTTTRQFAVID